MKELRIYMADDDTQFNNKHDCLKHELETRLNTSPLKIYKDDIILSDLMSTKTYQESTKVEIPDKAALKDMLYLQHFTGFYYDIDSVGTWSYDNDNGKWNKQTKETEEKENDYSFDTLAVNNKRYSIF